MGILGETGQLVLWGVDMLTCLYWLYLLLQYDCYDIAKI